MTTIQGESVPRDDAPTTNARRTQKIYEDILGRSYKTVVYQWDGTTAYTTTEQFFNGRDQVVKTKQTDNTSVASPQTHQDVLVTFDGHGRMKTRHYPIEDDETETTWSYNPDDSASQVTDPRGVVTDITYNNVGLTTEVAYTPTGSIPDTPTVTYAYDVLGNRTSMDTAGVSETTYAYDSLSRLTSETVDFDDLTSNYTIAYSYQLSGKLKSITDPFSAVVNYVGDKAGRVTSITGSGFASVSTYASDIKFRAFGAVKEMTYGSSDSSVVSYTFDDRLKPESYQATSSVLGGGYVRKANYEYFADGRTKAVDNVLDGKFDQAYKYDHMGRLRSTTSGLVTNAQEEEVPAYAQTIGYDAFGDMTSRGSDIWGNANGFSASYADGRKTSGNEVFDETGNIVDKTTSSTVYDRWAFDASGRLSGQVSRWYQGAPQQTSFDRTQEVEQEYDGTGLVVKRVETQTSVQVYPSSTYEKEETTYFIRSSVLNGQALTEVNGDGDKVVTYVYGGSRAIAEQRSFPPDAQHQSSWEEVFWRHDDPVTGSFTKLNHSGIMMSDGATRTNAELEPLGGDIPEYDPNPLDPLDSPLENSYRWGSDIYHPETGCSWDGAPIYCNLLSVIVNASGPHTTIEVNTRVEGGWDRYYSLQGAYRFERRTTGGTVTVPNTEGGDTEGGVDSYYELIESPFPDYAHLQARKLTVEESKILRSTVQNAVSGDCAAFISKLINQAAKMFGGTPASTDILSLFDSTFSSNAVSDGDAPSGIWGYLERSPGATAHADWGKGDLSIALPFSNTMYDVTPFSVDGGKHWRTALSQAEFNSLPASERTARQASAISSFLTSSKGAFEAIHELIHTSLKPYGIGDIELAQAALSFTGEKLDLTGVQDKSLAASNVWDDRLQRACGQPGRSGVDRYITKMR